MMLFAAKYPQVQNYFPEDKELYKWPRQYVINCLRVIIGE